MLRFIVCFAIISQFAFAQSSKFSVMPDWQPYQSVSNVEQKFLPQPWTFERTSSYGNLTPARFLSVDPLADKFPAWSPYHYSGNNPIIFIDPTGKEWYYYQAEGQKEAQWNFHKDTKQMEIWNGQYDKEGNKVMIMTQGIVELLGFNGSQLTRYQAEGGTQSWPAVSGVLDANGNTQPDFQWVAKGPIPEGWYVADPKQTQNWSDLNIFQQGAAFLRAIGIKAGPWPGGTFAWGEHRVPLSPSVVGSRSNFFIHGGISPGSAGCIDLTSYNNAFFRVFAPYPQPLKLNVRYPHY